MDIMRKLPDNSVDLVLTDPPYGVGKAAWDSCFPTMITWAEIKRIMKNGASILVFPGEKDSDKKLPILFNTFKFQWVLVWYKSNNMQFGKTGFSKHNLIWWLSKNRPLTIPHYKRDFYDIPIIINTNIDHPSPKPVRLITQLIDNYSNPGDLVLDPFLGSGTTAVACAELDRDFIGIEISPAYCALAEKRVAAVHPKLNLET